MSVDEMLVYICIWLMLSDVVIGVLLQLSSVFMIATAALHAMCAG